MTTKYSLVVAGAILAAVFNLVTADSVGGSTVVTAYPSGFELRQLSRAWLCCTPLQDLSFVDESKKVLQDFADGANDQKQQITLSDTAIAVFAGISGEYCRYIEKATGTVLTSPDVKMKRGTIFNYYAMIVEEKTEESVQATYENLKKVIAAEGGEPKSRALFKMMIVETSPEGTLYIGFPMRPYYP